MANTGGEGFNYQKPLEFECTFNPTTIHVKVNAYDRLSAEKALVEKAIKEIRWQLIKAVSANQIY